MTETIYSPAEILLKVSAHCKDEDPLFTQQALIYALYRFTDLSIARIAFETMRTNLFITTTLDKITARCKVDKDYRAKIIKVEEIFE